MDRHYVIEDDGFRQVPPHQLPPTKWEWAGAGGSYMTRVEAKRREGADILTTKGKIVLWKWPNADER
jgi:hypothetical protein